MSAALNTLTGKFFDGRSPVAAPATLIWSGSMVKVIGATIAKDYPTSALKVSPRIGNAERFVALPDGAQLQCKHHPLLDRLPQEGKTEGLVAWLEQRWQVALLAVVIVFGGLGAGYFWGLPAAAERIAAEVPIEYERQLGDYAINWLDENEFFKASELNEETRAVIASGFATLIRGLPMQAHYRLEFRDAPGLGPNALALPGGMIIVTDQMVNLSKSPEEVLAVLAHEIGHIERRHALRHILHDSVTATVAATLTSDASSLTLAVSGMPVLLAQMKYSREFETEADDYGFALLQRNGISPEHFATLMERLATQRPERTAGASSFLSTHPVTAQRVARARQAADRLWIDSTPPSAAE